jgi:hypothetical protein
MRERAWSRVSLKKVAFVTPDNPWKLLLQPLAPDRLGKALSGAACQRYDCKREDSDIMGAVLAIEAVLLAQAVIDVARKGFEVRRGAFELYEQQVPPYARGPGRHLGGCREFHDCA